MSAEFDAIVVGGNMSGLTVAYLLGHLGYRTALVEKSPHVGGMDRSFANRNGRIFDCGVHALDSHRSEVTARLLRHVIKNDLHESRRKRGIVLRGHLIGYHAPVGDWPGELRELLPEDDIVDRLGSDPPTRENLARYYGQPFIDLMFDEALASYPSETRHLAFGVDEWKVMGNIYPWFFPRAPRVTKEEDPSRKYHDTIRSGRDEYFLYPREGGFGAFAHAFQRDLEETGVEVLTDLPDLHVEMGADQRVSWIRAGGRQLTAPRVFWCAPVGILCGLLGKQVPDTKPDTFVLGSFQFERPVSCDYHEIIVGDPRHHVNRMSFPGLMGRSGNELVQLEFAFPTADPRTSNGELGTDPDVWRGEWLESLRRLGIVQADNEPVDFDFKTFPTLYNCYGVEGRPMPEVDLSDLHPDSNLRPVLPSIRSINLNTRLPAFLEYVTHELAKGTPAHVTVEAQA